MDAWIAKAITLLVFLTAVTSMIADFPLARENIGRLASLQKKLGATSQMQSKVEQLLGLALSCPSSEVFYTLMRGRAAAGETPLH